MKCLRSLLFALLLAFAQHACADGQSVQFIVTGDLHGQLKIFPAWQYIFRSIPMRSKSISEIFFRANLCTISATAKG